jgi:hypothetical protein
MNIIKRTYSEYQKLALTIWKEATKSAIKAERRLLLKRLRNMHEKVGREASIAAVKYWGNWMADRLEKEILP